MDLIPTPSLDDLGPCWEEDRKFVLRGWSLVFSITAAVMMLSVSDGRMAYVEGSYSGYLGFWTDCRRNKCADVGQVTVLIHMGSGFMVLALGLCLILLPCMGLSFRSTFRRLTKIDLVFSFLNISIGLLILLSLLLFTINCHRLHPKPKVSYVEPFYMCWGACALMLWAGTLSYLNHLGMWSRGKPTKEWQMSSRRRASRRWSRQPSDDVVKEMSLNPFNAVKAPRESRKVSQITNPMEPPSLIMRSDAGPRPLQHAHTQGAK